MSKMPSFYVELNFDDGRGQFNDDMLAHLDDVAEALADLTGVDGDVGADVAAGRVDLCITVTADNPPDALLKAFTAARTAIHTAGGHTGTWDGWLENMLEEAQYRSSVTPAAAVDCTA
ncbi:hypothetical protein CKJ76_13850 [Mycobacterium avium]|nr:hypothetical protein L837_2581 [Mycobacterium avium MAV_061107_1842]PBA71157.1 hypothetical protein CKJ76_13850 [Mycobacterium avium]PBJ31747.1 hypothetical protein BI294_20715 [Mycobacterium avium subsp. hominissuis]